MIQKVFITISGLAESDYSRVDVHLFEAIDAGEYIYCGRIELVSKPCTDVQSDEDDNDRIIDLQTVRLKKIDSLPDVSLGVVWFQDYYPMN